MFTGELKPYQLECAWKMLREGRQLVAMTMGSGKTPTSLAVTEDLIECGDAKQGLIVCLASLKYQWQREIRKFTTSDALVIDGTPTQRAKQYEEGQQRGRYQYVITNYEQARDDWNSVSRLPRDFIIADEVTALASFKAKRAKKTKRLQAPYMYGLTGTPIENRVEELYGIMQWVDPEVLGNWALFDKAFIVRNEYGSVVDVRNVPLLRESMEHSWFRVSAEQLKEFLPEAIPEHIPVRLDAGGRKLYMHITDDLTAALAEAKEELGPRFDLYGYYHGEDNAKAMKLKGKVMSRMTCLRMLCGSPQLLRVSAAKFAARDPESQQRAGSEYAYELYEQGLLDKRMGEPKLAALIDKLMQTLDNGHKVVIFTGWTEMLKIIATSVEQKKVKTVQFHGGMNAKAKDRAKEQFQTDPATRLFLSSDAGGMGVDLPQAAALINYDKPWSGGKADQRDARVIRLSSEHASVAIVDMEVMGSIEEWLSEKLDVKFGVRDAVVDGKGISSKGRVTATGESLARFLKENAP